MDTAFLSAAALSVLLGVLVLLVVRDSPAGPLRSHDALRVRQAVADLRTAWLHPGTRLGLWTHFTAQYSGTVFALLWGFPFLVSGEGLDRRTASALFTIFVFAGMAAAPFVGVLVQRHPLRRSWLVLGIVALNIAAWTLVLAWPGQAPLWLLVGLVLTLALGGPGSMIGFDVVWAVGLAGIVTSRRRVRARMAQEGVVVPPIREAIARRRATRRRR